MEQYYKVTMVNPFNKFIDLSDVITVLGTSEMMKNWSLGVIDISNDKIPHYVREFSEVDVIAENNIIEENSKGVEKLIELIDNTKIKIIYSLLDYSEFKYEYNEETHIAIKINTIKNIAIKTADGMIPLDKHDRYNFVDFINHNKRKLIKRNVDSIHNHLIGKDIILDSFAILVKGLTL